MKHNVNPLVAILIIAATLVAAGYFIYQRTQYDVGQTPGKHFVKPKAK